MKDIKIKFRRSNKGAPHTLIQVGDKIYSVVFISKMNMWKAWEYDQSNREIFEIVLKPGEEFDFMEELLKSIG